MSPDPRPRDLGRQPLAGVMERHGLDHHDLVRASPVQLTHKMVARAVKGRRLTENTMAKVVAALNAAVAPEEYRADELFDYEP